MQGDAWRSKIELFVDGELAEPDLRAMHLHLRDCPSCAAEALRQTQLKRATEAAGRAFMPPAQLRQRIAAQLAPRAQVSWKWTWAPVLATVLAAVLVGGALFHRSADRARARQLQSELTDLHVANLAASSPVEVASSDRHTVKPWFQGKLPFSFNLPELAGTPFTLVGGRLTYLDHAPGAHLVYDIGAHHVSVFILRDQPELARAFPAERPTADVLSFRVESWSAGGLRYFVVGEASEESLRGLIALLKTTA